MLRYKGYTGKVEFDDEARIFHGEIVDTRDVITFQGNSVDEIEKSFKESIDDYLDFCSKRGEEPERPFSGKLLLRIPSKLHHDIFLKSRESGKSLNTWVIDLLKKAS